MKVSELMNPKGVLLYAKIDNSADALGILVELQEGIGVITNGNATTMRSATGKRSAAQRPSGAALRCPTPATRVCPHRASRRCCCAAVLTGAHRTGNPWILCS